MSRRLVQHLVIIGLMAGLAACAGRSPTPSAANRGQGTYKVGDAYEIDGVWYYPHEDWSYDQTGIASWYGEEFHGRYTANGEIFDLNALTAAHKTLPMPSIVQVTNLENGRSIQLRVNDRGPYVAGRIIDVSRRAAQLLGFEAQGTAKVEVKILVPQSIEVASLARHGGASHRAVGIPRRRRGDRRLHNSQGAVQVHLLRRHAAAAVRPRRRPAGSA